MQVCNLTTPAQLFHCAAPPGAAAVAQAADHHDAEEPAALAAGGQHARGLRAPAAFQRIIPDDSRRRPTKVKKVLLCSGKVYYDLAQRAPRARPRTTSRSSASSSSTRCAPGQIRETLAPYNDGTPLVWVQEEPWNMGAWYYMRARLPRHARRPPSAQLRVAAGEREPGDRLDGCAQDRASARDRRRALIARSGAVLLTRMSFFARSMLRRFVTSALRALCLVRAAAMRPTASATALCTEELRSGVHHRERRLPRRRRVRQQPDLVRRTRSGRPATRPAPSRAPPGIPRASARRRTRRKR